MDRFVSLHTNPVDAKGRVSLPAPFRQVLARDGYEGLYVCPSLDFPALDCGGHGLLKEIDLITGKFPIGTRERDLLAMVVEGESEILNIDRDGRIILTDRMRAVLKEPQRIAFTGLGHKFQMWRPEDREAHRPEAQRLREAMRLSLSRPSEGGGS
jgi:MraZ protein